MSCPSFAEGFEGVQIRRGDVGSVFEEERGVFEGFNCPSEKGVSLVLPSFRSEEAHVKS